MYGCMAKRSMRKGSYVADPERRAYLHAIRTIREQVLRDYEKALSEAGLFKRILLRFRIEREIRRRSRGIPRPRPGA